MNNHNYASKFAIGSRVLIAVLLLGSLPSCATPPAVSSAPPAQSMAVQGPLRPPVIGRNAGVSAGHPLTTAATLEILHQGGNAFDAGVAALLVGGVVEQDLYGIGGEALILVYPQSERKVTSITGQGWAAASANVDDYLRDGKTLQGQGLNPAVVPGALHAALTVLERWGTMTFEQIAVRAIEYAELGFPLRGRTTRSIEREIDFINQWPDNQRYWLKPDGSFYLAGETIRMPGLANTFKRMVESERAHAGEGREAAIVAARDRFYKGDIAAEMVDYLREHGSGTRVAIEEVFASEGLELANTMVLGSNNAILAAVREGLGLAIMPEIASAASIEANEVVELDVRPFPILRHWHIVWLTTRPPSSPAAAFMAMMAEITV